MNEHAKKIYVAAMDGETVQVKQGDDTWEDASPFRHTLNPIDFPFDWRIKPKKRFELRHSRAYFNKEENAAMIFHRLNDSQTRAFEETDFFGGWLTDWIPYEVEVEG